jgi:hypothetical protein
VDYGLALLHYGAKSFKIGNHCHLAWRLATTGTVGAHLRVTQKNCTTDILFGLEPLSI